MQSLLELVDLFLELGQALVQGEEIGLYSRWCVLPIGLRQRLRRYRRFHSGLPEKGNGRAKNEYDRSQ